MQLLFPNNPNSTAQYTGISHIWGLHYSCHLSDTTKLPTNASLNKWLLFKNRLFSNHQAHSESCQASQKPPGRQTKADPSHLTYTALHFFMDTKGQCLCAHVRSIQPDTDTSIVPQTPQQCQMSPSHHR